MLKRRCRRQPGFSLIEIMISMAVLGLLLLVALPSFSDWLQNQQLRNAAEATTNGFQVARAAAIRRNLPVKIIVGPGTAWSVQENSTGTLVQARAHEEGTANAAITITPAAATMATFNSLGGLIANTDGSPSIQRLDITNPAGGACQADGGAMRCLRVTVSGGGSIKMCDPIVAAGDTRAC